MRQSILLAQSCPRNRLPIRDGRTDEAVSDLYRQERWLLHRLPVIARVYAVQTNL